MVITDPGDWIQVNLGNLLALSYEFDDDVSLLPFPPLPEEAQINLLDSYTLVAYRPSEALQKHLEVEGYQLEPTTAPVLSYAKPRPS